MKTHNNESQFINNITPKSSDKRKKPRSVCYKKRPCYRDKSCRKCWDNRVRFLQEQLVTVAHDWNLSQFLTLNILGEFSSFEAAFSVLLKSRPKVHEVLRKEHKYISVVAVKLDESRAIPHFHIICSKVDEAKLKYRLDRKLPALRLNVETEDICEPLNKNLINVLNYMLQQNMAVTRRMAPARARLISASFGFKTGRRRKTMIFRWLP